MCLFSQYAIPKVNMLHNLSCYETRFRLLCRSYLLHSSLNLVFRQHKLHNIQARIQTGLSGLYKPIRFLGIGSTLNNSHNIFILNLNSIVFHYFSRSSFCIIIRLDLSHLSDFLRIKMNTCSCSTFIFLLQYMQWQ